MHIVQSSRKRSPSMLSARSSRSLAIRKSSWRNVAHHLGLFPKDLGVCAILFSASRERRVMVANLAMT